MYQYISYSYKQIVKALGFVPASTTDVDSKVSSVSGTAPISSSGGTTPVISLNDTAVTPGTYGSASQVPNYTVDSKGRLTAAANTTIAIASTAVTDFTEAAQDAVGAMVDASLVYVDDTPLLQRAALTGDITASAGSNATTLATVNSNVGSFGTASSVPTVAVTAKGLTTAASNTAIQIAESQVTNLTTDLAAKVSTSSLGNLTDAGTDGITITGGTGAVVGSVSVAQHVADSTHSGYLSSTDWSTFNNKQAAVSLTTTGASGASTFTSNTLNVPTYTLVGLGGVSSTLTNTHILVGNGSNVATDVAVSGEVSITNTGVTTVANSAVIGKVLTGYTSGAGTVSATDTLLQAIQKINGNVSGLTTGVSSVFGRTGAVTATSGDYSTNLVTENTNLYFTNARAIAATLTAYSSGAGTVSATDTILQAIQKLNGNISTLYVPYTGATSDLSLGAHNYKCTGYYSSATTAEGTSFDFRDSTTRSTTLGYSVFGQVAGGVNGSVDIEFRNINTHVSATADLTLTSDVSGNYGGVGIANSTYNQSGFSAYGAYCTYLYSALNDVVINASTAGKVIDLVTGTGNTSGIRARASDAGFHVYGATPYGVVCGPTASNGALQSTADGTLNYVLTGNGSALPTFQNLGMQSGSFTVNSTTPSTPAASNAVGSIGGLSAAPAATTGSGSVVTVVNSTSAIQCTVGTAGQFMIWCGGNMNGAATAPNFGYQFYFNTVANQYETLFTTLSATANPVTAMGYGAIGAGQTVELKWRQATGTGQRTTTFAPLIFHWVWKPS